jgi:hypothetical protein
LCSLSDIIRVIKQMKMKYSGRVTCVGDMKSGYRIVIGKCQGMRPLRKLKRALHKQFLLHNTYDSINIAQVGSPYMNQYKLCNNHYCVVTSRVNTLQN